MNTKHPPRPGDLPVDKLVRHAQTRIENDKLHGITTQVHFKFTCEHCGTRCTLETPNTMFEYGTCHACGKETRIVVGGYTMISKR